MRLAILLLTVLVTLPSGVCRAGEGMGIGPALSFVEEVRPGVKVDLGAKGLRILVQNNNAQEQRYEVVAAVPDRYDLISFEPGYDCLPDSAWVALEHNELVIPPHGTATTGLTLNVPDRPEHYNRHWMLYIEVGLAQKVAVGAGLRVRSRVMVETVPDPAISGPPRPDGITITPGRLAMVAKDGVWSGTAAIRNDATRTATYDVLTIRQAFGPGLEDRRMRFFGTRGRGIIDVTWAKPDAASFSLDPGATRTLRLAGNPDRAIGADDVFDEVVFVARHAGIGADRRVCRDIAGRLYDRIELVRMRFAASEPQTAIEGANPR